MYCLPYIQGVRVRLGYSPKGGTIRVNVSARKTKLAGNTIYTEIQMQFVNQAKCITPTDKDQDPVTPDSDNQTGYNKSKGL